MTRKLSREDETYKFIIKKLGIRFHKRLGYDGDSIEFKNVELTPLAVDDKFMDIFYNVDGKTNHNIELQSSPVYEFKLKDMLVNAVIEDIYFHLDLFECQKKMLQRFFKVAKRKKVEKMLNLKAKDFGFEPNVTGFEESVNLAYLDGKREGFDDGKIQTKLEDARNLLELGVDEEIISKATGLDLKTVMSLK